MKRNSFLWRRVSLAAPANRAPVILADALTIPLDSERGPPSSW